jgi:hypothetical protein
LRVQQSECRDPGNKPGAIRETDREQSDNDIRYQAGRRALYSRLPDGIAG